MRVFLASIPLEGRKVVVVGGGEAGAAKARLIARTPADWIWYAPDALPPPAERPAGADPLPGWPEPSAFDGAVLVFLAVFDAPQTLGLAAEARARGALVNVVDRPELCDFHTPALVDRGEVVIGIATGGAAPILARDLRASIESILPAGLEQLAGLSREIRDRVKAAIADPLEKRRYWEQAFRGRAADLAASGEIEAARAELDRLLVDSTPGPGVVWFVSAPDEADLLTLEALRVLQNADVVVHDLATAPGVLDLVRRDARRLIAEADVAQTCLAEAALGARVVRLGRGGLDAERRAVETAGVAVFETRRP